MLRITGYSDKYAAFPGEKVQFYVNSENGEKYEVQIVRLIHGDTNPEGPGYKEEEIGANCNGDYEGQNQKIHGGSYIIIPQDNRLNVESFTLQAYIFPTTPDKGKQGILTKWNENNNSGFGLFIDDNACLSAMIGDGDGQIFKMSSEKKLLRKVWYLVALSFNSETGKAILYQEPCVTPTNGGLGMSMLHPAEETTAIVEGTNSFKPGINDAPFLMAASTVKERSGRNIQGGHYKETLEPIELPEQSFLYNGKIDRPRLSKRALSKAEIESLASGYSGCASDLRADVVGAWDFHTNITTNIASTFIVDTSPSHLNGFIINLPVRGMTGYNWTADDIVYHHKPEEYGAIHFHDDDIDDARWDVNFTFEVPNAIRSGIYAARLRINGEDTSETEDFVPFVIKPPKGKTTSKLALILPTNSYMAYSNDNLGTNSVVAQLLAGKVPVMAAADLYLNEHREYGLSTYSLQLRWKWCLLLF